MKISIASPHPTKKNWELEVYATVVEKNLLFFPVAVEETQFFANFVNCIDHPTSMHSRYGTSLCSFYQKRK
jgi:hypothetical protein